MSNVIKLAPSILSADFAHLGKQVGEAEQAGADRIHVDVMDGHFVPNISMGVPIVASLRRVTRLPLEIHMMITDPDFFLDEFTEAGSDSFLVHWEGNNNLHRTVQRIKALGKRVGVGINPATPAVVLEEIVQDVDQVLVMTVNPGFGQQHFIHSTLPKVRRVRQMIDELRPGCDLEVDGGIDATTAPLVVDVGANVLVAGSAIFSAKESIAAAMERIRGAVESRNTHHEGREEHEEKTSFCQKGQKKRNISSCPSCASYAAYTVVCLAGVSPAAGIGCLPA